MPRFRHATRLRSLALMLALPCALLSLACAAQVAQVDPSITERPAATPIRASKIVLVGDSTTAVQGGWGPSFCANHVTSFVACVNLARGGRSSHSYRAEGSWDIALRRDAAGRLSRGLRADPVRPQRPAGQAGPLDRPGHANSRTTCAATSREVRAAGRHAGAGDAADASPVQGRRAASTTWSRGPRPCARVAAEMRRAAGRPARTQRRRGAGAGPGAGDAFRPGTAAGRCRSPRHRPAPRSVRRPQRQHRPPRLPRNPPARLRRTTPRSSRWARPRSRSTTPTWAARARMCSRPSSPTNWLNRCRPCAAT